MALTLCACGSPGQRHETADYVLELEYKPDFRVLVLSDIHLGNKDDRQLHFAFMDLTIADADADLIVLDGDTFTFADRRTARDLFAWLDGHGIPWTMTFGNHDEQAYFSIDWLTSYLTGYGSNCVFRDIAGDDVFGYANFAVNLMKDGAVVRQLIVMDSNRYDYGNGFGYDTIKQNQIDWYERLVTDTAAENGGTVPSVLFFHIPLPEIDDAWSAAEAGADGAELVSGEKREKCCPPNTNTGFFDTILALGSTTAIVNAHDHLNDFTVRWQGVYFSYCVHSTNRVYGADDMMGGLVLTLHEDGETDFEPVFHSYEEVG